MHHPLITKTSVANTRESSLHGLFQLPRWAARPQFHPDDSLDLSIRASSPGAAREVNWLPAPESGPFNLTVRDYWPKEVMLDGT